jgi:hypothetical protein
MSRRGLFVLLLGLAAGAPASGVACGDKFLVPGRWTRFRAKIDRESATVLLYARPGSPLDETLRARSVADGLRKAGYRPTWVNAGDGPPTAIQGGPWDVVVADLGDVAELVAGLSGSPTPLALPVAYDVSRAALDEARQRYRRVLKAPSRTQAFLDAIDELVYARARARARAAREGGGR